MRLTIIDWIAIVLVVIGALNWGLVGLFQFDLVQAIIGGVPIVANIIYILVGVAGLWLIYLVVRLRGSQEANI